MFLVLSTVGFSVTLSRAAINVVTINANTSTQFTTDRTLLNWIVQTKAKAYINIVNTQNATVEDQIIYPGVYNTIRLKASQPNFKILGTGTENVTIVWQDPASGVYPMASGYDTEKVMRTYITGTTTTTTNVPASQYLVVANDNAQPITVNVTGPNGYSLSYTLLGNNIMDEKFPTFTQFVVTTTGAFRAYVRR